ncbi:MAG: diguanylate cyclase (GGDEF)-like protein [Psychrobacter glaciei]|jgi:diguanylate cyclase (GGDEF)-like protein
MSLRNRIVLFFLGLLIVSTVATIGTVLLATNNSVKAQAQEKLNVGKNVFEQLLYERGNQLLSSAKVLVADFGFKDAISSNDKATIKSALINNRVRINADLMFIITLDNQVISSNADFQGGIEVFKEPLLSAQKNDGITGTILIDDNIFKFVMLPVKAPVTLAWAIIATKVDKEFALQLKGLTNLDVVFNATDNLGRQLIVSTIENIRINKQTQTVEKMLSNHDEQYLTLPVTLADSASFKINAYLNTSLKASYLLFYPLKIQIILIACITLLLSIISAFFIARRITTPIIKLAKITQEISSGNYLEKIESDHSSYELSKLSEHFSIMQKEISLREEKLTFLAYNDNLTGIANRSFIIKQISDSIQDQPNKDLAIVRLSIDNLKETNDTFGYDIGDGLLISFSKVLISYAHQSNYLARISESEFIIVFNHINENTITNEITNLQTILQHPLLFNDLRLKTRIIMGASFYPKQGNEAEQLLRRSEIALNQAKALNSEYSTYQEGQDEHNLRQIELINSLSIALETDLLNIHYQAKVDTIKNEITQAEALLRWTDSKYGFVSPEEFITLAEQTGLMPTLTQWVLNKVFCQAKIWEQQGLNLTIAINLSAYDLVDEFPEIISKLLTKHNLSASMIMLEITESAFINNPDEAIKVLHKLKNIGFSLSIDDYGTGYSSLSQLKKMPVDELKIDKSFVLKLEHEKYDQAIVQSTIELAHNIGLSVVAEGVETLESFSMLKKWNCNKIQGYYISRPISAEDFETWIKDYKIPEVLL